MSPLIQLKMTYSDVEAMKKMDVLVAAGYHLPVMQKGDKLHCTYTFTHEHVAYTCDPQRIIDVLDHTSPETFQIKAINVYQIEEYIDKLHALLRLAEKMRTTARFVPSELPKPEPVEKKSWWKRLWT